MRSVAYLYDPIFLRHDTGVGHPESALRLKAIDAAIAPLQQHLISLAPRRASEEEIALVHTPAHIASVRKASEKALAIDADTRCSVDSYEAACYAAGAGLHAIEGIVAEAFERAFCAVRPPGHHATPNASMGFCLFNNVAITARYALASGFKRVLIIDFDVHHGNGTQEAFYEESSVMYISTHQAFAYPGTGMEKHRGAGEGEGFTRNFLLMPESDDPYLLEIYEQDISPLVKAFEPDILLVSAGYDLHESDPLASLNISHEGIRRMVRTILDYAEVPTVFFLEGGYDRKALGENVRITLEEMLR